MIGNLLYRKSNENLTEIFNNYSVKDKDVLTVLASSDQLFSCIYCGAKSVDTFDINPYTLYYYYLRKWLITYTNEWYPSYNFFEKKDIGIYDLVCSIKPSNIKEKEAKNFWKTKLEHYGYSGIHLFEEDYVIGSVPYLNDSQTIKNSFENPIDFKQLDFSKPVDIDKKYDVIILSNMLEYNSVKDNLRIVKENIEKLLDVNGIAILSYKMQHKNGRLHQLEVLEMTHNKLTLDKECEYYESLYGQNIDLAYSYRKIKD